MCQNLIYFLTKVFFSMTFIFLNEHFSKTSSIQPYLKSDSKVVSNGFISLLSPSIDLLIEFLIFNLSSSFNKILSRCSGLHINLKLKLFLKVSLTLKTDSILSVTGIIASRISLLNLSYNFLKSDNENNSLRLPFSSSKPTLVTAEKGITFKIFSSSFNFT